MEITFQNKKIHFTSNGEGNPLVLLHGFLEDSRIWIDIVKDLQKSRQVICIDLPGHGKSDGIAKVHDMPLMSEIVHEVVQALGLQQFSIAGHSMGGYVSLEFLNNFPMMLESITLINSTPVEDSVEKRAIREKSVKLVEKNKDAYVSMAISNLYFDESRDLFGDEIEKLKQNALKISSENVQAALKGMKIRTNNIAELKAFQKQKFIIAAKDDPILDFTELKKVSKECGTRFFELQRGHNSYMEDSAELQKIMHFID